MKVTRTNRGFGRIEFEDLYDQKCSLQDSSLAAEAAIWFGVDKTTLGIDPVTNQPDRTPKEGFRMHLTASQVKELLPYLIRFAETEEYISEMEIDDA